MRFLRRRDLAAVCELVWRAYLGDMYGTEAVSPYDSPARAEDLAGPPPA